MRQTVIILFLFLFSAGLKATYQTPDFLIIEKDTFQLQSFLLETHIDDIREDYGVTSCWRGYIAYWRIVDDKLYLEKILSYPSREERNIIELFEERGFKYQEKDGMILADWCTITLYRMISSSMDTWFSKKIPLYNGWDEKKAKMRIKLKIENGIIVKNKLKRKKA